MKYLQRKISFLSITLAFITFAQAMEQQDQKNLASMLSPQMTSQRNYKEKITNLKLYTLISERLENHINSLKFKKPNNLNDIVLQLNCLVASPYLEWDARVFPHDYADYQIWFGIDDYIIIDAHKFKRTLVYRSKSLITQLVEYAYCDVIAKNERILNYQAYIIKQLSIPNEKHDISTIKNIFSKLPKKIAQTIQLQFRLIHGLGKKNYTLTGHTKPIVALIPINKQRIASAAQDGTIKIWDSKSHTCIASIPIPGTLKKISMVALQQKLAFCKGDSFISIFDGITGDLIKVFGTNLPYIQTLRPVDNTTIAATNGFENIELWDINEAQLKKKLLSYKRYISGFNCFDNNTIVVSSCIGTIHFLDIQADTCSTLCQQEACWIDSLLSLGPKKFACNASDNTINIWHKKTVNKKIYTLEGHTNRINGLVQINNTNTTMIASVSDDKTIKIWNNQICINTINLAQSSVVLACLNNKKLITADTIIRIFPIPSFKKTLKIMQQKHLCILL